MKVLKHSDKNFSRHLFKLTNAAPLFDDTIDRSVQRILNSVRKDGDQALLRMAKKFDNVVMEKKDLRVTDADLSEASQNTGKDVIAALKFAHKNIELFHRKGLRKGWKDKNTQDIRIMQMDIHTETHT